MPSKLVIGDGAVQIPAESPAAMRAGEGLLLVLDTNICLDLFVFADPACSGLLVALRSRRVRALTRADCLDEWHHVLRYSKLGLDDAQIRGAERDFDLLVALVADPEPSSRHIALPRCDDPDDQKFLELARDQHVFALLSRDQSLLRLAGALRRRNLFKVLLPESLILMLNLH